MICAVVLAVVFGGYARGALDENVEQVMKSMAETLAGADTFSFHAMIESEDPLPDGQLIRLIEGSNRVGKAAQQPVH